MYETMLLIIQNGYITPYLSRYMGHEKYEVIRSFENDTSKINIDKYSLIIILGGNHSVKKINQYPHLENLVKLINTCIGLSKPMLGICLGAQLIAYALGCQIESMDKYRIGYNAEILGHKNVFRSHIDYIVPNDQITVLEYFESMPYLYTHKDFIFGIQCHPDIAPECVQKYSNDAASHYYAKQNRDKINETNADIMKHLLRHG